MTSASLLARRLPADAAFLARRLAAIDWPEGQPDARWTVVEACRAELDWAWADWLRLGGSRARAAGRHPAELARLPHEQAAARLLNCHFQADAEARRLRLCLQAAKAQRSALRKEGQRPAYRASWQAAHARTLADIADGRARRAAVWRCFLAAAIRYRRLRGLVEQERPQAA